MYERIRVFCDIKKDTVEIPVPPGGSMRVREYTGRNRGCGYVATMEFDVVLTPQFFDTSQWGRINVQSYTR